MSLEFWNELHRRHQAIRKRNKNKGGEQMKRKVFLFTMAEDEFKELVTNMSLDSEESQATHKQLQETESPIIIVGLQKDYDMLKKVAETSADSLTVLEIMEACEVVHG